MNTAHGFAPLAAGIRQAVKLSMQRLWLTGQVLPAGARLLAQHVFQSAEDKTIEVIYSFPLPRDAALRRFRITGHGFEAHSELKETEAAVQAFEEGIAKGSLSTLARLYGDGVVNLTVGNIRPNETVTVYLEILCGVELRDDGFRFRFPFTLAPAYHPRAKVAEAAPGEGEMELPADEFGDMILPRYVKDASGLHEIGFDLSLVSRLELEEIGSPSHGIRVRQNAGRSAGVGLAAAADVPNRDLVLDARYKSVEPQVLAGKGKDGIGRFAAILPSSCFGGAVEAPRRLVILLDRSGSMQGEPISQARKAIEACLALLSETDYFGLVAFDNRASTFQTNLAPGTRELRDQAHAFLKKVEAQGGTELANGFLEAAKLLGREGGDILILTDGQVSGTGKIVEQARATGVRLHCLGIGSASQDRFLSLLARETGGVSRFVTPRERVDLSAVDLFASVGRTLAAGLAASANIQPGPPRFVFKGTPVLLFGEESVTDQSQIELKWDGGRLILPVHFSESEIGDTVWLLQGSRLITDWESRYSSAAVREPVEKRRQNRIAARLLSLSQTYGLASREMSLVAVVTRPGDRPNELPETQVVPVGMAQDTAFGAYFGKEIIVKQRYGITDELSAFLSISAPTPREAAPRLSMPFEKRFALFDLTRNPPKESSGKAVGTGTAVEDVLLDLASRLDSDGGMPGKDQESRALASVIALLAFLSQGHTTGQGAFRLHVGRLVAFLESLPGLPSRRQQAIDAVIDLVHKGAPAPGEWIALARTPGNRWKDVERSVLK